MPPAVSLVHSADAEDPGQQARITASVLGGLAQRPVGGGVPARLDVYESQLTQDVSDQSGPVRGAGGQQPAVQHHSSLTIGSPDRMDQGTAQGAQHLSLDFRVSRPPGLGSRAAQRLYPGVDRARVQGSRSRLQQRRSDHHSPHPRARRQPRIASSGPQRRRRDKPLTRE